MCDFTILAITNDDKFLSLLQRQFHDHIGTDGRVFVTAKIDEACSLLNTVHPRLVLLHWTRSNGRYEELDRLLWETTVQTRQIPVVVIAERYRPEQATMMYRMGVKDFISRTHHHDQLGRVVSAYLPRISALAQRGEQPEPAEQSVKGWSASQPAAPIASRAV